MAGNVVDKIFIQMGLDLKEIDKGMNQLSRKLD